MLTSIRKKSYEYISSHGRMTKVKSDCDYDHDCEVSIFLHKLIKISIILFKFNDLYIIFNYYYLILLTSLVFAFARCMYWY